MIGSGGATAGNGSGGSSIDVAAAEASTRAEPAIVGSAVIGIDLIGGTYDLASASSVTSRRSADFSSDTVFTVRAAPAAMAAPGAAVAGAVVSARPTEVARAGGTAGAAGTVGAGGINGARGDSVVLNGSCVENVGLSPLAARERDSADDPAGTVHSLAGAVHPLAGG